jgi:secondary thiamine-phosphate synthase enzyme
MISGRFSISTAAHMEFVDITTNLQLAVDENDVRSGMLVAYNPHTTAGITINEGADPAVQSDLVGVFRRIIPKDYPYKHREGNSPSHIMTTLTGSSATIFIEGGRLQLGTWQRIFFCEFDGPRSRNVWWKMLVD